MSCCVITPTQEESEDKLLQNGGDPDPVLKDQPKENGSTQGNTPREQLLDGKQGPVDCSKKLLVPISDPQRSTVCTTPNVSHSPEQENSLHETQMLQNGNSGQNEESEQPKGTDYGKMTNLLRQIFFPQFFCQLSLKTRIICALVVAVVVAVIVIVPIIATFHKEDKGGAAANGKGEQDSRISQVLPSEIPGTGVTSTSTTSYGNGDHANCGLVFINEKSRIFNDSESYCKMNNGRLLQEKDLKTVGHCIPKREDFWAKKGDDSDPGLCYIYNTEHKFVSLDCTTGRRCICVKDPNTTKKNEET